MSSSLLASALNTPFDQNIIASAAPAEEQRQDAGVRHVSALRSPWERAVQIFNHSLTKDETKQLSLESCPKASLESFIQQVSAAKETATKKRSKVLDRVNDIVSRINLFSKPMDTFSQANQELMFAWGMMKFLMGVVMSEKEISDKLAEAIADVVQIFGRCEQYGQLFASEDRVLESIGVLYADVLNLLVRATRFYEKDNIKRFMSATVTPFEVKFKGVVDAIQKHAAMVENETRLAHANEQRTENDLQSRFRQNLEIQHANQTSREVRLWLQPSNSANDLEKLRDKRTADTCTWLLAKEQYVSWATSTQSNILWVYGIPGGGKTFLASYVIDNLFKNGDTHSKVPVIYFFCNGRNESQRTSIHILRSLVSQFQLHQPELGDLVAAACRSSAAKVANSFDELWNLFKEMCNRISVICVIDGLDECQERDEDGILDRSTFAHNLVKLAKQSRSGSANELYLKILLTSRNEPDLRIAFQSASDIVQTLRVSLTDVSKDINNFITKRINHSEALSELSDDMKALIFTRLAENAGGMFIWARLMIEQLEATESDEALEEALRTLPSGLFALYDRILTSLAHNFERNDSVRDLGCFVICWVVHGTRPLTLTELSEARCIKLNELKLSMKRKPRSLAIFRRLIQAACSPLVEVQDDGLVQLAHHTTKEYLLCNSERLFSICNPIKTFGVAASSATNIDYILSLICFSYLSLEQFEIPLLGVRRRFAVKSILDVQNLHPFLEYATTNWLFHLSRSKHPPYTLIHNFVLKPQALTWVEAAITLQGGLEKLATTIEYLPSFAITTYKSPAGLGDDYAGVTKWFESLQRAIFDWGGTLNQTPSEIHFLDVLGSTSRSPPSRQSRLEKFTLLEDPTMALAKVRPLGDGATFLIHHPYVYVLDKMLFTSGPFLKRYHWLSMQYAGEIVRPQIEGFPRRIVDVQVCPNHRFISAVELGSKSIYIVLWSINDEGFDPVPWADHKGGIIGSISTDIITSDTSTFSHLATFEGSGWRRSARHIAFSEDGKTIWTPAGAFDLKTGKESNIPNCCSASDVTHATWSLYGQRLACIRGKKTLEVYENNGKLVATTKAEYIKSSMIVEFSKSGRYLLLLQTETWQHVIYDIHLSSFLIVQIPTFATNPFKLEIPTYNENWSIVSHSFSPCERYFSFLRSDLNQRQPTVLCVWDRKAEKWVSNQIWEMEVYLGSFHPLHVQFDSVRSETLHLLVSSGSYSIGKGICGFIHIDLEDEHSFDALQQVPKLNTLSRFNICLNGSGGRVFQRMAYSFPTTEVNEGLVDMIVWDLSKALPEVDCRFTVPKDKRELEGWRDGYSQSNGAYGDWYALSDDFSMFLVGGRLYSISDKTSESPKLIRTFDASVAWKKLLEESGIPEEKQHLSDLNDECFWSFFSPDGSLVCFYASKEYTIVYNVQTGGLRWCFKHTGSAASNYRKSKPIFHPSLPIMAWVGQLAEDAKEDFNALKHCGVYLVDLSSPNASPARIFNLEVDHRSDLIFSPCGFFLYGGMIGRDDYNFDERKLKFFKISLSPFSSPPQVISHIKALSPIKGPSYCGSPNPAVCALILKDDEPHFLITFEYKVMLSKIEFDGTVKWKMIASLPGPPKSPEAIALSGWNREGKEGRLDIVLAAQTVAYATVINTWDESPGEWDKVCRVEHDPSL